MMWVRTPAHENVPVHGAHGQHMYELHRNNVTGLVVAAVLVVVVVCAGRVVYY